MGGSARTLCITLLAFGLGACAAPRAAVRDRSPTILAAPAAAEPKDPPIDLAGSGGHGAGGRVHVVRPGETLFQIARQHGVDPDELADLNQIHDPKKLGVGREILLPGPKGRKVASAAGTPPRAAHRQKLAKRTRPRAIEDGPRPSVRLRWPVQGVLYGRFGARDGGRHDGVDIAAPEGTRILAAADGEVLYAGVQRGYGNIVIVRHAGERITVYAHNQKNLVAEGARVRAGQPIALVGRTGRASGPHCHFEVREQTRPQDPLRYLDP